MCGHNSYIDYNKNIKVLLVSILVCLYLAVSVCDVMCFDVCSDTLPHIRSSELCKRIIVQLCHSL